MKELRNILKTTLNRYAVNLNSCSNCKQAEELQTKAINTAKQAILKLMHSLAVEGLGEKPPDYANGELPQIKQGHNQCHDRATKRYKVLFEQE